MKYIILFSLLFCMKVYSNDYDTLNNKVELLAEELLKLKEGKASKNSDTTFGGYGEFVYKNKRSENESNQKVSNSNNPSVDAQRFILYISHKFSEKWNLTSEIEVEHADEIFLEQATLDYNHSSVFNFQAGVMLIPVGIINVYHEPTAFLGVNRPEVSSKLIPTTWREVGLSVFGKFNDLSYRLSLVDGLKASGFSSDGVRGGRQKASQAEARDLAWVARLDYSILGIGNIGASTYIGKAGGVQTDVDHKVYDIHSSFNYKGLEFDAVYSLVKIGNIDQLNLERGLSGSNSIASEMSGYWTSLGYNVLRNSKTKLVPFLRYEAYDTHKKVGSSFTKDLSKDRNNLVYGLSFFPTNEIVFKADYTRSRNKAKTGTDSWNLGFGWNF